MYLIRLAIKNLTRHKKRTLLTAGIIALAVVFYIFLDSLMLGMKNKALSNIIDFESGHIQVANKNYWEQRGEFPLENLMDNEEEIIKKIEKLEGIKGISPQLKFFARLNNGIDEIPVPVEGIIAQNEKEVFAKGKYFIEGNYFSQGEYKAVLGKNLADLMGLKNGDYFTLLFKTKNETFNTIDLKISGLLETPNPNINSNRIFIPLSIAQKVLNVDNKISQYALRVDDKEVAEEIDFLNKELNGEIAAFPWQDSASSMIKLSQAQEIESEIILGIILIIAVLGIINSIILAGIERVEEIGMMKALGMKEREIILTFVYESTGIGVIGAFIGAAFSFVGVGLFQKYGIDFFKLMGTDYDFSDFGMPIMGRVYGEWNPETFLFIIVFVILISSIVSIFPAMWAAKKEAAKAIHHKQ